jgi:hypothetical protein
MCFISENGRLWRPELLRDRLLTRWTLGAKKNPVFMNCMELGFMRINHIQITALAAPTATLSITAVVVRHGVARAA